MLSEPVWGLGAGICCLQEALPLGPLLCFQTNSSPAGQQSHHKYYDCLLILYRHSHLFFITAP